MLIETVCMIWIFVRICFYKSEMNLLCATNMVVYKLCITECHFYF